MAERLTLKEAAQEVEFLTGVTRNRQTVNRWCVHGIRVGKNGCVKLRRFRVGGQWFVTRKDLRDFLDRIQQVPA